MRCSPPPSEDEIELSQSVVTRAFGLSSGGLQADDEEEQDTAIRLHSLSEATGLESEGGLYDEGAAGSVPWQRSRDLLEVTNDANGVLDGEDSGDYIDQLDDDDDVLSDSDAVEMDAAFLASLQTGNSALSRTAIKDRENALRAMKWTPLSSQYETNIPSYPGLGTEEARPVGELLDVW
ncbi:hypothetical protein PF011_g3249 [Phytophthora fragariae]|uniref:PiggyBac transposable element-derived protein domain-containing protein n=1 Tax=Phytophthora fragariae TaxID=53985 RepID=A0A6A3M960_9STRA|nr:hypothetical protein PF009_g2812 [Phytophthora fragariae]KAE9024984.1 hypothetical protein PF011_g3249 [Phytophthora fragariae]